ncbi:MAG: N-acetylmuramoyl-L-alanine amidase [Candidatus Promineifilaceae bacterium]|jgi:N-acetylmuramoyl-L-alanine amidase
MQMTPKRQAPSLLDRNTILRKPYRRLCQVFLTLCAVALLHPATTVRAQNTSSSMDLIPIHSVISELGVKMVRLETNVLQLTNPNLTIRLVGDSRRCVVNGVCFHLNGAMQSKSNRWVLNKTDVHKVLTPLFRGGMQSATNRITVVLDPGHGGHDPGAADTAGLSEKMLALDVAQRIKRRFHGSGIDVKLTRNTDVFLSLRERTRRAAAWDASVFVSIHMNSAANESATGIETYILPAVGFPSTSGGSSGNKRYPGNTHDAENSRLAYFVHQGLHHVTQARDRGVKRSRFDVLCHAPCPAVLVECGFLSSKRESAQLLSLKHRETVAEGISQGLLTYLSRRYLPLEAPTETTPLPHVLTTLDSPQ